MKWIAKNAVLVAATAFFMLNSTAQTSVLAPGVSALLPAATLVGQAKMRFLGFEIYEAKLWVSPGFVSTRYAETSFALELVYLRDFKGTDIARRSMTEMQRQGLMSKEVQTRWEAQMRALFPDVKDGDRITGVNQPGVGATFWHNGKPLGDIRDTAFARQFFGIWLSEQTSELQLRQALLAQMNGTP